MTAPARNALSDAQRSFSRVRAIRAHERARLVAWLDDGLRAGRRGRLEAEYPLSLSPRDLSGHRAVYAGARPAAHAMLHVVTACASERAEPLGLIGNVYTDPAWRGRGLARRCVEACAVEALARGCAWALLWSDLVDFYGALGFHPAGTERRIPLDAATLARARAASAADLHVAEPSAAELAPLEALYARKPAHARRAPGALAHLARAPEVALRVAHRSGAPIAYAACGRGDDLRGVVHEWAGDADGVLACAAALHAEAGARMLLASAHAEPAAERLLEAGAKAEACALGLARPLGPERAAFPRELYLWGFDSI